MSPVVLVTASMPSRKANASTGVIRRTKGSMMASVVGPPRPGRMPTANPIATPISISPKEGHAKTWDSPVRAAWTKSPIGAAPAAARRPARSGAHASVSLNRISVTTGSKCAERARVWFHESRGHARLSTRDPSTHGRPHAHARLRRLRPDPAPQDGGRAARRRGAQGARAGARGDVLPDGPAPRLRRGRVLAVDVHRAARSRRALDRHPGLSVLRVPALRNLRAQRRGHPGAARSRRESAWECPSTT